MIDKEQRMQAIAITAFGGPDRLTLMEQPVPTCDWRRGTIKAKLC